ncbi:recombinase family protein [Burkholderia diffusa]|uniref:recombinase family protein n=1 Tax=Burkholderia diffusa TaxID=488732 RepID=UPI000ABD288A|nr:recombinase family protein [Burkholderia diffusa]
MKASRVYSYLRFSNAKQADGSSIARQLEYATRWAAERGMTLDASLTLRDEGLSAYHQKHVKKGALGTFLRAIEDGRIPAGSVLIVEGLDRLSRAEPVLAQAQLAQIINAGITVVTASDGREYNFKSLKAQPMDLVYSLLVMIRAHEESETKSTRVKAAIRRQCEGWIAGTYRGTVAVGHDPRWITRDDKHGFVLIEKHAATIRMVIDCFKQGLGGVHIMRVPGAQELLAAAGIGVSSRVYEILRKPTLIGDKVVQIDGETYTLKGYYPPVLSDSEFAELQHLLTQRGRRPGKGVIPGIITGMRLTVCGYCGSPMASQNNLTRKRKTDGLPPDGHRRLVCTGSLATQRCHAGGCSVVPIEKALMAYCSEQMNLDRLLKGAAPTASVESKLALARERVAKTHKQLARVTEALLDDEASAPAAFTQKARELEAQLAREQTAVDALERELETLRGKGTPAAAKAWAQLAKGVEAFDPEARLQARQLVADTFSQITIYRHGFQPVAGNATIDMVLVAKNGNARLLHIDRITGEWRAGTAANLRAIQTAAGTPEIETEACPGHRAA